MICTTLNDIRKHEPCNDGWKKLLGHLGKTKADGEPLPLATILESNGIRDAIWALRALIGYDRQIKMFTIGCARQAQHLMIDERSVAALDAAEGYLSGTHTLEQVRAAADAAYAAAYGAAAYAAARAAAYAADATYDAAYGAAAYAACAAAYATDATYVAPREKQVELFKSIFCEEK